MTTPALRRLAVGLVAPAALVLGLAACGSDDVSKDKFTSELEDKAQLTEEQATCVTDRLYDELDQSEINDLYSADNLEDAGEESFDVLSSATADCITAEG
ncbi:MAG TPA: hypothetical protein VFU19_08550 [Iamia sp.]|nr:hypothetical protein [Iamia sp.]